MYGLKQRVVFWVQVSVLNLSYAIHAIGRSRKPKPIEWIVGPYEVATLVHTIATALPSARSVVLARHPFYTLSYDWQPKPNRSRLAIIAQAWLLGPYKLGKLATESQGFIYLSGEGFLNASRDQRHYEFRFLKRRGCAVVCYFTGNDIRSPQKMRELERETGKPNLGTYLGDTDRVFTSAAYEHTKRRVAEAADRYADIIFNADVDQRGYLERASHPFLYFYPDDKIQDSFEKFAHPITPVIVHAPSSPIIKGTQLVRAAIDQLRDEGYQFEYVELIGVSNDEVMATLSRAHISLNEFFAAMPGVFGIESMAAGCVLLTSADEAVEPQLPLGSNDAWVVTEHHQITSNLRALLDDPGRMEAQARAGNQWVRDHAAASVTGPLLNRILSGRTSEPDAHSRA